MKDIIVAALQSPYFFPELFKAFFLALASVAIAWIKANKGKKRRR